MDKITNCILSIPIKMVAICSFLFVVCIFITIQSNDFVNWNAKNTAYQNWLASDAHNVCKTAEEKCRKEISLSPDDNPYINLSAEESCLKKIIGNTTCSMYEPIKEFTPREIDRMVLRYVIFFSIPFVLIYALKFFAYIKHEGWKRVILSSSCGIAALTYFVFNEADSKVDELEMIFYAGIAFLATLSFPYFFLHFVLWIREGFTNKQEVSEKQSQILVDKSKIVYYLISKSFNKFIILLLVSYFFILSVYLMFPSSREKIFSQAILAGFVVVLFLVFDRLKTFMNKQ